METHAAPFIPDLVREKQSELDALCREFGVARLELFGSATSTDFNPETSDLDFIVDFDPDFDLGPWTCKFFELERRLADLFGRDVDLLFDDYYENPFFRRAVDQSRIEVYAA